VATCCNRDSFVPHATHEATMGGAATDQLEAVTMTAISEVLAQTRP
jgi:hypothetical protein